MLTAIQCDECRAPFAPSRKTARFCSRRCRVRWWDRINLARQHIVGHWSGGAKGKAYKLVAEFWPEYL